jgi:hypothetical protein
MTDKRMAASFVGSLFLAVLLVPAACPQGPARIGDRSNPRAIGHVLRPFARSAGEDDREWSGGRPLQVRKSPDRNNDGV